MIQLTILLFVTPFADSTSLEQKASDYFFSNIFKDRYGEYNVVEFATMTDTAKYYGIVYKCEKWDNQSKAQLTSIAPSKSVQVRASSATLRIKKIKSNSRRLKIYLCSKVKVGDNYFVLIHAYRKLEFANYYFLKFDDEKNIVDSCFQGEII